MKKNLYPILGRYEFGEYCNVVFLDYASTHMTEDVKEAINDGALYFPHSYPIEICFLLYKAYLKQNSSVVG